MCRFGQQTVFGQFQANLPRQILRFIIIDYQRIQQSLARDKEATGVVRTVSHFPGKPAQAVWPVRPMVGPYTIPSAVRASGGARISPPNGEMLRPAPKIPNIQFMIIPQKQDRPHPIKPFPNQDIRMNILIVTSQQFACTGNAGLHFIGYKKYIVGTAQVVTFFQISLIGYISTCLSLNGLNQESGT